MTTQAGALRWAVRAVLTLGVAASVTANVLHARDNLISQAIAAWPPLALLITVELVTRIPVFHRVLGMIRILATTAIAGIAAWISYHHMAAVAAHYGESDTSARLLPLSVDGLIVVASICLVELSGRPNATTASGTAARTAAEATPARAAEVHTTPRATPANRDDAPPVPQSSAQAAGFDPDQTGIERRDAVPPVANPARGDQTTPWPDRDGDPDIDGDGDGDGDGSPDGDLAADLVPLLPAARTARDELVREGRPVSRDALARRLRRNGHAIRNTRVSELLNALRREEPSLNGAHRRIPV